MKGIEGEIMDNNVLKNFSEVFEYSQDLQFELLSALEKDSKIIDEDQTKRMDIYKNFVMEF
jgi:hypothetical protein